MENAQPNYINFYHIAPLENRLPIEQAPSDREWMTNTAGGYAYRCLPMSYANRHGWCVRLQSDVEVIWDGGTEAGSLQIICGREQNGFRMADNGTGNGIVTFHLNAIPRTSEDWNMWIMGAPNLVVPGASPLSGIVESDWAFGGPTSNWKITTPNTVVTFKKGDPVFFFVPVRKTELESFELFNFNIKDDEDINKHFVDHCNWRAEMDAAGKGVNGKMYRRGIRADGTKPDFPYNHKTTLTLHTPSDDS